MITFHQGMKTLLVVREQTRMDDAVPNQSILVSKFHLPVAARFQYTTMTKLHELHLNLLPFSSFSPDLGSSDFYLSANLDKMLAGKSFDSNEEMISETNAYFEVKDKSFCQEDINMLERALK